MREGGRGGGSWEGGRHSHGLLRVSGLYAPRGTTPEGGGGVMGGATGTVLKRVDRLDGFSNGPEVRIVAMAMPQGVDLSL